MMETGILHPNPRPGLLPVERVQVTVRHREPQARLGGASTIRRLDHGPEWERIQIGQIDAAARVRGNRFVWSVCSERSVGITRFASHLGREGDAVEDTVEAMRWG